ncbi:uncharacterized protein MONOS_2196 [Monocercomonoides exilis]|uniref:uncharacterized protein n=1 Tax=Monocercomonoides exilis TaxID=2049356 RepID=UPI00355A604D|nr:hypothetical protein MONOS_2196 [Monocercomonoides exilis]|eukprot:MONOS_2196.1-p1 / transcript=MONOS_2196.1 / gene=MONOS_2196 / organism=Monocercomonoides_exilis_PA203 / gene_product=unspecified product / transcript_product=unspecified product / location=Mono_scaffold00043:153874-155753(+) / protein_length=568 / sequence_SO=supercontig / SO=protein_coding / is_pseudo=false
MEKFEDCIIDDFLQSCLVRLFSVNNIVSSRCLLVFLRDASKILKCATASEESSDAIEEISSWKHLNTLKLIGLLLNICSPQTKSITAQQHASLPSQKSPSSSVDISSQLLRQLFFDICLRTASLCGGFNMSALRLKYVLIALETADGTIGSGILESDFMKKEGGEDEKDACITKHWQSFKLKQADDGEKPPNQEIDLLLPAVQIITEIFAAPELHVPPLTSQKEQIDHSLYSHSARAQLLKFNRDQSLSQILHAGKALTRNREFQRAVVNEAVLCLSYLLIFNASSVAFPELAQTVLASITRCTKDIALTEFRKEIGKMTRAIIANAEDIYRLRSESGIVPAEIEKEEIINHSIISPIRASGRKLPILRFWEEKKKEMLQLQSKEKQQKISTPHASDVQAGAAKKEGKKAKKATEQKIISEKVVKEKQTKDGQNTTDDKVSEKKSKDGMIDEFDIAPKRRKLKKEEGKIENDKKEVENEDGGSVDEEDDEDEEIEKLPFSFEDDEEIGNDDEYIKLETTDVESKQASDGRKGQQKKDDKKSSKQAGISEQSISSQRKKSKKNKKREKK